MEEGKAQYIEGLLKGKKFFNVPAFTFVKLRDMTRETPRFEVHTYRDTLGKHVREFLDAVATLNGVEWQARASGQKIQIVIYRPVHHQHGVIIN